MASSAHLSPVATHPEARSASFNSDRLRAELAALPDSELLPINLDILALTMRIQARLPQLLAVEQDILARWQQPRAGRMDRLEAYSGALVQAHHRYLRLQEKLPSPSALAAELAYLRQRLLKSAGALTAVGVLAVSAVEPYRLVRGHRALARSVCGLASVFLAHWDLIRDKTPVELADLEKAIEGARELSVAIQGKHRGCEDLARAVRERQQLFTLLLKEYAELRRAAQFLYGKEEAARRVPSLYEKKPARSGRSAVLRLSSL